MQVGAVSWRGWVQDSNLPVPFGVGQVKLTPFMVGWSVPSVRLSQIGGW